MCASELYFFFSEQCVSLNVSKAEIAHDQPINSVCISLKDDLIASGSQDKTAKVGLN